MTLTLIQAFKQKKEFALFTQKGVTTLLQSYADHLKANLDLVAAKNAIKKACDDYVANNESIKVSVIHHHGADGVNKANAFKTKIDSCNNYQELTTVIDQLFRLNQVVGVETRGAINHNPSSYIRFFYQAIYPLLALDSLKLKDPNDSIINKVLIKSFTGAENVLVRLAVLAVLKKFTGAENTKEQLGQILNAIKNDL